MSASTANNFAPIRFDLKAFAQLFPELKDADLTKVGEMLEQAYAAEGRKFGADVPLVAFERASGTLVVQLPEAPELVPPITMDELGGDGISVILGWLQSMATGEATATQTLKLQANSDEFKRQAELAETRRREAADAADRAAEAAEASRHGRNAMTAFGLIAAGIVAALAFVFGGPALAIVAAAGLTMAVLDTVNTGLQNANVTRTDVHGKEVKVDVSIGGLVALSMEAEVAMGTMVIAKGKNADGNYVDAQGNVIPEKPGVKIKTQEEYDKHVMAVTIAVTVVIAVAMLATGVAGVKSAAKEAAQRTVEIIGKINKFLGTNASVGKAEAIANGAEAVATIAEGASAGASAGLDAKLASENLHLAESKALKKHIDALISVLSQESEATRKLIEKLVNDLTESMSVVAKAIGNTAETADHLALAIAQPTA